MQTIFTITVPFTSMYKTYISSTSAIIISVHLLIKFYTMCAGFQLCSLFGTYFIETGALFSIH
jgi:hypothetical protein